MIFRCSALRLAGGSGSAPDAQEWDRIDQIGCDKACTLLYVYASLMYVMCFLQAAYHTYIHITKSKNEVIRIRPWSVRFSADLELGLFSDVYGW